MNVKELFSLKGKVCLVTGGVQRYGKCVAEGLAEADGTVVITSRSLDKAQAVAKEFQDKGLDVIGMALDQAQPDSVNALIKQIDEKFGGLDVFVNNAVLRPMRGYADDIANFAESMRVNATGMWHITREATELIKKRGGGSIIHISSMMGMFGPDLSNYTGSTMSGDPAPDYFFHNAGLLNLARYQAHVLSDFNIRANCICPGGLMEDSSTGVQDAVFHKTYTGKVLAGHRMAGPDDIKGPVVFLASEASSYMNGESLLMDGGMHC